MPKSHHPRDPVTVLTLDVVLQDVEPSVWRRLEVPSTFTFFDLHSAILDAMGWRDAHLHEFTIRDPRGPCPLRIGLPDDEFPDERPVEPGWTVPISRHLAPGQSVLYVYDFGDDWRRPRPSIRAAWTARARARQRMLAGRPAISTSWRP